MTKKEAAEKVAKLMRLSRGTKNAHEATSARERAEKLAAEHGLTSHELEVGEMGAAFDDLVDQIQKHVADSPAMGASLFDVRTILKQVTDSIKGIGENDKSARLRQAATIIRTAAFVAGDNKIVASMKAVLDATLKNHQLTI
jgi:hypothetical protein